MLSFQCAATASEMVVVTTFITAVGSLVWQRPVG
jgi:hypothetical protein